MPSPDRQSGRQVSPPGAVRERILSESLRLFAARGFEGTSLAHLAEAVGIRKQSLLYHFSSKDELRRAVLERLLAHWNDVLPALLRATASGEDQFDLVMQALVSFFTADPDRARLLIRELLDRPAELGALIRSYVAPWIEVVCGHIRKGQEQGTIRSDVDPEAWVTHIINVVVSSVATYQSVGSLVPAERHVAELMRVARSSLFVE